MLQPLTCFQKNDQNWLLMVTGYFFYKFWKFEPNLIFDHYNALKGQGHTGKGNPNWHIDLIAFFLLFKYILIWYQVCLSMRQPQARLTIQHFSICKLTCWKQCTNSPVTERAPNLFIRNATMTFSFDFTGSKLL